MPRAGELFPGMSPAAVSGRIRRLMRRLAIAGRPHDLRASFGTQVARASEGDLRKVQRLLRHSSIITTERYVTYWPDGADLVNGLFVA